MLIKFEQNFVNQIQQEENIAKNNEEDFSVTINGKCGALKDFVPVVSYCIFNFSQCLSEITSSMNRLSDSIEKNTQALDALKGLSNQVNNLDKQVTKIDNNVSDLDTRVLKLETELGKANENIMRNTNVIANQEHEIRELKEKMEKVEKSSKQCCEDCLDLERYSRSFNLRLSGIKEEPNEKPELSMKKAKDIIKRITGIDAEIEYGHRVGKAQENTNRTIIFKLFSRVQVRAILNKRKDFFSSKFPLHRDLPKRDLIEKLKFADLMKQKYENNEKIAFTRGSWYVNNVKFIPPV